MNKKALAKVIEDLGWLDGSDRDLEGYVARALDDVVDGKPASREVSARILRAALSEEVIADDAPAAHEPDAHDLDREETLEVYHAGVAALGKEHVTDLLEGCARSGADPRLAVTMVMEATARLGRARVEEIESYCEQNHIDLAGCLAAELDRVENQGVTK